MTHTAYTKKYTHLIGFVLLLAALVLLASACGRAEADPSGGADPGGKAPSVLRVGYIGANKLNLPSGAEGWGFYKGGAKEELKNWGSRTCSLSVFPTARI